MDKYKTPVIFRQPNEGGEVVAFFPTEPADLNPFNCMSYQHTGQHGGASLEYYLNNTQPATQKQSNDLKIELESLGYNLQIRKRFSINDFDKRIFEMNL